MLPIAIINNNIISHIQAWEVKDYKGKEKLFWDDLNGNLTEITETELENLSKTPAYYTYVPKEGNNG